MTNTGITTAARSKYVLLFQGTHDEQAMTSIARLEDVCTKKVTSPFEQRQESKSINLLTLQYPPSHDNMQSQILMDVKVMLTLILPRFRD